MDETLSSITVVTLNTMTRSRATSKALPMGVSASKMISCVACRHPDVFSGFWFMDFACSAFWKLIMPNSMSFPAQAGNPQTVLQNRKDTVYRSNTEINHMIYFYFYS
jgi:hypothetical protein